MMATASTLTSMLYGLRCRCPNCGSGALYRRYLKPVARCEQCGEPFDGIRADDFPPYLTILIVGHVVVPLILLTQPLALSTGLQVAIWVPVTLLLVLLLLPRFKGAVIGLMWSLGMGVAKPQV
jgi:uncharacterized protein (DUF983 family)